LTEGASVIGTAPDRSDPGFIDNDKKMSLLVEELKTKVEKIIQESLSSLIWKSQQRKCQIQKYRNI